MTEDEMVGRHHRLNGHEFEQAPGDGDRQGGLACCSPWGHKESDTTERLSSSNNENMRTVVLLKTLERVPWTARRSNQSILKEIHLEYSLEGLMAEAEIPILWPLDAKT